MMLQGVCQALLGGCYDVGRWLLGIARWFLGVTRWLQGDCKLVTTHTVRNINISSPCYFASSHT